MNEQQSPSGPAPEGTVDDVVPHPFGPGGPGDAERADASGPGEPETRGPEPADGRTEADEPSPGAPAEDAPADEAPGEDVAAGHVPGGDGPAEDGPAGNGPVVGPVPSADPPPSDPPVAQEAPARPSVSIRARRRRDPLAAALIGVLTLLLGFAFAVQVRNADGDQLLAGAREEDLVRILDEVNAREERLREQIADQRNALEQLSSSDSQSATALEEAQRRAQAIGILNGTLAAQGPGLIMTVRDPDDSVRVADVLDAIQELRGAGAETMQIDGVRVGVSTAVTGDPGSLMVDGRPITAPYEFLVIGSPQNMQTAMNIPGGVVQRITGRGGTVAITQSEQVVVDALRPLDTPQYASPDTGN